MKSITLGYFKAEIGNVGDDLNPWLWKKVLSNYEFNDNAETVLVGVGSILDTRFDSHNFKLLLGSGARSPSSVPQLDETWETVFVRGPKTQAAFSKQKDIPYITDPAILIANYFTKQKDAKQIGFVPYFKSNQDLWKSISEKLGYKFISPCNDVDTFSKELSECHFVITEAMHGAIFADSMRIPWIAVSSSTRHYEQETHLFKWQDWCASMKMNFQEIELPTLWAGDNIFKKIIKERKIKNILKSITVDQCQLSSAQVFDENLNKMNKVINDLNNK